MFSTFHVNTIIWCCTTAVYIVLQNLYICYFKKTMVNYFLFNLNVVFFNDNMFNINKHWRNKCILQFITGRKRPEDLSICIFTNNCFRKKKSCFSTFHVNIIIWCCTTAVWRKHMLFTSSAYIVLQNLNSLYLFPSLFDGALEVSYVEY